MLQSIEHKNVSNTFSIRNTVQPDEPSSHINSHAQCTPNVSLIMSLLATPSPYLLKNSTNITVRLQALPPWLTSVLESGFVQILQHSVEIAEVGTPSLRDSGDGHLKMQLISRCRS